MQFFHKVKWYSNTGMEISEPYCYIRIRNGQLVTEGKTSHLAFTITQLSTL